MFELPWTPNWAVHGASLWCLASKMAHAGTASLASVLEQLVGATVENRLPIHAPSETVAAQVANALELDADPARLFTAINPAGYVERQRVQLALKFCPHCMEHWFHSAVFQFADLDTCPWHRCRLQDCCPHCRRAIDPLGPDAWKCSACHRLLAPEPGDWLQDFKTRPGHSGALRQDRLEPGWFDCLADSDGDGWACVRGDVFAALDDESLERGYLYEHQHARLGFEEACVMWETLLAQHRDCAKEEPMPLGGGRYSAVEFKCPVAAAAIAAFGWTGARSQVAGDWQLWHGKSLGADYAALGRAPHHLRKALIRDLGRVALCDALWTFGRVAKVGRWRTKWDEPKVLPAWLDTPVESLQDVRLLKTTTPLSDLLKARNFAASSCVRFQLAGQTT